ncbi:MAG: transposase [Candidatus Daviesbacteria bacterium]|nr:transposase [Candidatus Daviesbacteria bacterium]
MATNRKIVFKNEEIYHIFNRGVERREIFTNSKEFSRMLELIKFYRFSYTPIRYSQFLLLPKERQDQILDMFKKNEVLVEIIAFCLMPNHFHFIIKQRLEKGITTFMANISNSYAKYFNTKNDRVGPLFQGAFKAVYIETNEQLIHLSRYIHLNPVVSSVIDTSELNRYRWSSYFNYISKIESEFILSNMVLNMFKSQKDYEKFVLDQIDYGKKLEIIKHLALE